MRKDLSRRKNKAEVVIEREGIWSAIPSAKGNKGLGCTLFGYKDYRTLYKSYLDGILRDGLLDPFGNLCEGQCWLSAMLRYMTKYGYVSEYAAFAERALNRIMRFDERGAVERYSVLTVPHAGLPAYNVYKSQRVQEQFFGAGIFLDAFNALGDKRYLEFAVNMINSALSFYQREDGRIETFTEWLGKYEDYSIVCCPMINIVDVALALKESDPEKAKRFLKAPNDLPTICCGAASFSLPKAAVPRRRKRKWRTVRFPVRPLPCSIIARMWKETKNTSKKQEKFWLCTTHGW
ncbi:MAG: hypothetical protein ACLR06_18450 [Christensenellaceae bacterium]